MRVLIVEDNEGAAYALQRKLRAEGWDTEIAPNGAIGEEKIYGLWDAIIMDFDLGIGFTRGDALVRLRRQIEAEEQVPYATIITYSGSYDGNKLLMDAGANVNVGKMRDRAVVNIIQGLEETHRDSAGEARGECGECAGD